MRRHRKDGSCRTPWFLLRFKPGDIWRCSCGRSYRVAIEHDDVWDDNWMIWEEA